MSYEKATQELFNKFSRDVDYNYSLQNKCLFKKKAGNAKGYYQLVFDKSLEKDLNVLSRLYKLNIPFKIFGSHSNLYITENGYNGLFIDLGHKNADIVFDEIKKTFTLTSNVTTSELVNFAMKKGYDFSALAGIPGLVGSGVVGNSSWTPSGKDFSDFVQEITLYDFEKGEMLKVTPDNKFFRERDSFVREQNKNKTRYFVKEIVLKSDFFGEDAVRKKYNAQMERRKKSLKFGFLEGTAGSLWSNVHLRETVGKSFPNMLRENPTINANYNGAKYSPNGSMFFTTESNTTDKDVAKLFIYTLDKAKELYKVELHKEVMILDNDGEIDLKTFIKRNI